MPSLPGSRFRRIHSEQLETRNLFAWLVAMDDKYCPQPLDASPVMLAGGIDAASSIDSALDAIADVSTVKTVRPSYTYASIGNTANSDAMPSSGLVMMGGGKNVDAAFRWLAEKAGGGDFVVLSAGKTSYLKYINDLAVLDSVESLIVPDSGAANDPFVADKVASAEAIFITGGDQGNYIANWADTALESAIYAALARGAALGGTSAGLAVLGEVDYAALLDSTTSAEALANPMTPSITLDTRFLTTDDAPSSVLRFTDDTITDSHFMQRDRMGRTLAFMARADVENQVPGYPRAIAINEQTALLVDSSGSAFVVGNAYDKKTAHYDQQRSVYVLSANTTPTLGASPLNYSVQVQRLNFDPITGHSDTFNMVTNSGVGVDLYTVTATAGVLSAKLANNQPVGIYGPAIA